MLSKAEAEFLRGSKQAKPQQLRYLRHCVKRKITALRENDLPAIMANDWAKDLFRDAIEANSGYAIESNSAARTHPSGTQDLSGPGRIRTGDLRRVSSTRIDWDALARALQNLLSTKHPPTLASP